MPSRYLGFAIVVLWLMSSFWFLQRECWDRWFGSVQSPYLIDLARESQTPSLRPALPITHNGERIGHATMNWEVFFNRQTVGMARFLVHKDAEEDVYNLHMNFDGNERAKFKLAIPGQEIELHVKSWESLTRVSSTGAFLAQEDIMKGRVLVNDQPIAGTLRFSGTVVNGFCKPVIQLEIDTVGKIPIPSLSSIEVHEHYSIFNPMQPWDRLNGLQKNQTWRITLFVPVPLTPIRVLEAGVLQATDDLRWNNRSTHCLKIMYRDDKGEEVGATWVRESDGLVLRQEAEVAGKTLSLERRPR